MEMESKQVIETEIAPMLHRARTLVVRTKEDRDHAAGMVKFMKEMRDRIEETFHPTANREKALRVYQALKDSENAFYGPIDEAEKLTKTAVKTFDTQEAIRAQRDAERLEAERRDKEEKERAKLEAKAEKELEKGNTAKAETLFDQAENVQVAPSFAPPPAAVKKLTTKAEVLNRMELCKLIAAGVIPFSVIDINQAQLNAWAKTVDPKKQYDGIRLYQESAGRI